jgi:hypothetical protein
MRGRKPQHGLLVRQCTGVRMQDFAELSVVRVRMLIDRAAGAKPLTSDFNRRAPAIGDIGTVLEVLRAPGRPPVYLVECCDARGATVWLCECLPQELEVITPE